MPARGLPACARIAAGLGAGDGDLLQQRLGGALKQFGAVPLRAEAGAGQAFPEYVLLRGGQADTQGAGAVAQAMKRLVGAQGCRRGGFDVEVQGAVLHGQPVIDLDLRLGAGVIAALGEAFAQQLVELAVTLGEG